MLFDRTIVGVYRICVVHIYGVELLQMLLVSYLSLHSCGWPGCSVLSVYIVGGLVRSGGQVVWAAH